MALLNVVSEYGSKPMSSNRVLKVGKELKHPDDDRFVLALQLFADGGDDRYTKTNRLPIYDKLGKPVLRCASFETIEIHCPIFDNRGNRLIPRLGIGIPQR